MTEAQRQEREFAAEVEEVREALAVLAVHTDVIVENGNLAVSLKSHAARCRRILEEEGEPARTVRPPVAAKPPAPSPPPPAPPPVAARVQEPATMFSAAYIENVYATRKAAVAARGRGAR